MECHDGVNTIIRKGRGIRTHSVPCEHIAKRRLFTSQKVGPRKTPDLPHLDLGFLSL